MNKYILLLLLLAGSISSLKAQELNPNELPNYVVVTVENTRLVGAMNLNIDTKKSPDRNALLDLEDYLTDKDRSRVRTITDLLNTMDRLGFDYIDAYDAKLQTNNNNRDGFGLNGTATVRTNVVFKRSKE